MSHTIKPAWDGFTPPPPNGSPGDVLNVLGEPDRMGRHPQPAIVLEGIRRGLLGRRPAPDPDARKVVYWHRVDPNDGRAITEPYEPW